MSLVSVELEAQPAGTIASPPGYVELPFEFDLGGEALRDSYEGSLFGVRSVNTVMHAHGCTLTLLPPPRRHGVMVTVARPWWTFDVLHYEPFGVQGIMDMGRMPRYARRGSDDGTASDAEEDGFDPAPALTQMPEWMEMQELQKTASLQDCANAFMARGGDLRVVHPTDGTVRCVVARPLVLACRKALPWLTRGLTAFVSQVLHPLHGLAVPCVRQWRQLVGSAARVAGRCVDRRRR